MFGFHFESSEWGEFIMIQYGATILYRMMSSIGLMYYYLLDDMWRGSKCNASLSPLVTLSSLVSK